MERVLQPTTRDSEAERVREKKARTGERTIRLNRLYNNEDFKLLWKILQSWDESDVEDLTKPELKKEGVSLDYWYGFINGRISKGIDIRDLMIQAVLSHKKDATNNEQ